MPTSERRGLGRGLGAIIRDTSAPEPLPLGSADATSTGRDVDRALIHRLATVGLDLLDRDSLTHLGYLHVVADQGPELVLRRPCLEHLDPTAAYRLLAGLDRATKDLTNVRYSSLGAATLAFVPSRGPHSTGVHLLGWTAPPPEESAQRELEKRCRAVAQVVHQLHRELETDNRVHVRVERRPEGVEAVAIIDRGQPHETLGRATADDLATAVVHAILAADGSGLMHRTTRSMAVDPGHYAVLTVLTTPQGAPVLGFSMGRAAEADVAASAARRALGA